MKTSELRTKSTKDLQALIAEKRTELVESRKTLKSGDLTNASIINKIRRDIAVSLTIVNEQAAAGEEE